jgi:MFS transporter, DHA3 family, macrolide efflux protein
MPGTGHQDKNRQVGFTAGKDFLLYSASQFVSCLGDAFQTVATAVLLFGLTGSGLYAGIGAVFPLLSGILISPFAGFLGDRFSTKRLLAAIGIVKGFSVMMFEVVGSLWQCYALIIVLSVINVFYGIPGRKITPCLVPGKNLLVGNSLLNGLTGAAFFVGPSAAGLIVKQWGAGEAMVVCGSLYILSSLLIPFLVIPKDVIDKKAGRERISPFTKIMEGCRYCLGKKELRNTVFAFSAISFGSASTNMAFYPYSFDILRIDPTQWGVIVSVFNGVILLSTAFSIAARRGLGKSFHLLVFLPCMAIAAAWLCYSLIGSFAAVLPALALEGTSYFFVVTLLTTKLQLSSDLGHMARVLGTNDIFVNASRLLGIGAAWAIMHFRGVPAVFAMNAAALFTFALAGLYISVWRKQGTRSRPEPLPNKSIN